MEYLNDTLEYKWESSVVVLTDWQRIANKAAFTQDIEPRPITERFLRRMILSQHSPLRAVKLELTAIGIPYYTHVHLVRHHVAHEPYVSTQRDTSMNPVDYDRRKAPQDAPVKWTEDCNVQSLIDMMKKRLCANVDIITRNIALSLVREMRTSDDMFLRCVSYALRPACEWHGGYCFEVFSPCGVNKVMDERWWGEDTNDPQWLPEYDRWWENFNDYDVSKQPERAANDACIRVFGYKGG